MEKDKAFAETARKIDEALEFINQNYAGEITRDKIAEKIGLSPDYVGKIFKIHKGKSFNDYINELYIKRSMKLLTETDLKVHVIAFKAGFKSIRTFNRIFYRVVGETPTEFRNRNYFKQV